MKYLVKKRLPRLILKTIDHLLEPLHRRASISKLDKILLCNIAHLGDAVIASSIIRSLKKALPQTKIGFLCSNSAACVFEGFPNIDWLHKLEHWKLNRTPISKFQKVHLYRQTKAEALQQIKDTHYDIAIDLYPYFPNAIPLLWKAKIPVRIGYTSGGFGPLLTHPIPWKDEGQYCLHYHYKLLEQLPVSIPPEPLQYDLPLSPTLSLPKDYLLFHMGTGGVEKEWPEDSWRELALLTKEKILVFTGKGPRENQRIERVSKDLPHAINLCDQLTWKEFCFVISHAAKIVSLDSAIAHLAEAYSVTSIVLLQDPTISIPLWNPPHAKNLLHATPRQVWESLLK